MAGRRKKYLLREDEVAYFDQELESRFNLSIADFKSKGIEVEGGHEYEGYRLESIKRYWRLSVVDRFHTCPYKVDVDNDSVTLCECGQVKEGICRDDI